MLIGSNICTEKIIILDYFSRFTWILTKKHKNDALKFFINFAKIFQNKKGSLIGKLQRTAKGTEKNSSQDERN